MPYLLDNVSANTVGAPQVLNRIRRGEGACTYSFYAWGTLGGGTVTLWISPDGNNWFTAKDVNGAQAALMLSDVLNVDLRGGFVRAILTGAAGASGVFALIV